LSKIAESQTLILAKFTGKAEPNPVVDLKRMRSTTDEHKLEELDYGYAPSPNYIVEDLVKMVTLKTPAEGGKVLGQLSAWSRPTCLDTLRVLTSLTTLILSLARSRPRVGSLFDLSITKFARDWIGVEARQQYLEG
jgi:hypothetical protein